MISYGGGDAKAVQRKAFADSTPNPQEGEGLEEGGGVVGAGPTPPPYYMNSAALSEIAGELLVTVRELREELIQVLVDVWLQL